VVPIKKYSHGELEKIAEDFLNKWGGGKYDGRMVRIEALIEGYGYSIWPFPGLSQIAEAYIPAMDGYIFVDEFEYNRSSKRLRFTLAEELAHILVHRPLFAGKSPAQIKQFQQEITAAEYKIIEQNAKYLAGAILMKQEFFRERFKHFSEIQSVRTNNNLHILRYVVRELNLDFDTSCYAICLRALHLGLIDQEQLDDLMEDNPSW